MDGWIKIHRIMTANWKWRKHPETGWLFLFILTHCNYKESVLGHLTIKPGQLLMNRRKMSEETGISEQSYRTIINRLKSTQEITHENVKTEGNICTLITVVNWSKYQTSENQNQPTDQPTTNPRSTHDQPYPKKLRIKEGKNNTNTVSQAIQVPFVAAEIIRYLNQKANKSFDENLLAHAKFINARMKEGATVEDFKAVIDIKVFQWLDDNHMDKNLRPKTLFNSENFDGYLQEAKSKRKESDDCDSIINKIGVIDEE